MIEFKFRSRTGNANAKPRVYFTCAPGDEKYFDEIASDILKQVDCAIYYADGEIETTDPDYEFMLGNIQAMVFPVTAELLFSTSRALDYDIPLAKSKGVPLLPLMQASGLDAEFNIKVGEIQYLDKYAPSVGALPYEKKLSEFLSSVLVSEELANKIRSAFDAYVFLSYRKKDRRCANEVMRRIHEFDFTRDIAIWFDEFLTPGENFNDAILDALNKSELFAMVVTPNLINEKNYVMEVEYPRAKNADKKILPIESVKTDESELKKLYPDIPKPVEVSSAVISDELLNCLRNLAIRENDTPEHNYYIALAYLYGIDLEVDKPRALKILEDSAQKGCVDAVEKLAQVYSTGECGVVDLNKVLQLRESLVKALKREKNDKALGKAYESLAKAYYANHELGEKKRKSNAKKYYLLALKQYQKTNAKGSQNARILGIYCTLINNATTLGEFNSYAKKAEKFVCIDGADDELAFASACYYEIIGTFYLNGGKIVKASEYLNRAQEFFASCSQYSLDAKLHLAFMDIRLGELFESNGEFDASEHAYKKAIEYAEMAVADAPSVGAILAKAHLSLGLLYYGEENLALAEENFLKSVECAEKAGKLSDFLHFSAYGALRALSGLYGAEYHDGYYDEEKAKKYTALADQIERKVREKYKIEDEEERDETADISGTDADAQIMFLKGKQLFEDGETEKAIALLTSALTRATESEGVVLITYELAMCYYEKGETEKAKETLLRAIEIFPQTQLPASLLAVMREQYENL